MIRIKEEIYMDMLKHCINCFPLEACGLLAGKKEITEIYKIKNIEASSTSFFFDPLEQLKAFKDIKVKGIEMLAVFHSHPFGDAYPSFKDIELACYDVYHIIIAIKPQLSVRCFTIKEGVVKEVELDIV